MQTTFEPIEAQKIFAELQGVNNKLKSKSNLDVPFETEPAWLNIIERQTPSMEIQNPTFQKKGIKMSQCASKSLTAETISPPIFT